MKNKIIITLLLVGAAIIVISYFAKNNEKNEVENKNNSPNQSISDIGEEKNISEEEVKKDVEVEIEKVQLEAVGEYEGNAVATRSFSDGKFNHGVVAEIGDPGKGKFYEGWLVKGTSFFSTGKMKKEGEAYVLRYEANEDKSSFNEVVITEETEADGLDGKPEAHVFEGSFK